MASCKFCEDRKPIKSTMIGKGLTTARMNIQALFGDISCADEEKKIDCVFYDKHKNAIAIGFDNSSGEYAPQYVEISFCPFCGKRLKK